MSIFLKDEWEKLHALQQLELASVLQSEFFNNVIQNEIRTCYDRLASLDTGSDPSKIAYEYRLIRQQLDFFRSMYQFIANLTLKPLAEE